MDRKRARRHTDAMRQAVLGVVLARGHATASDVRREMGLSWTMSQGHLKELQRGGALSSVRLGRRVAYYVREDDPPERELLARRVLSNPQAVRVARVLVEARGGASVRDVRRAARVSQRLRGPLRGGGPRVAVGERAGGDAGSRPTP